MTLLVDAPARVDGVQLIGEMVGSGYRRPPALVRRADGQVLQLTPLLYLVLHAADGRRTCAEIAELVGRAAGRAVSETDVRTLVDTHLRPLGLLRLADGSEPELKRSNPLLSLRPRVAVTDPRTTRRLTDPFRVLFRPAVVAVVLAGFLAVVAWVFFDRGLGASAYDAFERPHLLLLVFVVSVLSAGFHEFGHAAAARYSGGQPGAMGAGFYLVWPAFYTDVTDSYRLDRAGRIRTDLGGLYFNAIVACLTFVWWWATGWEALLLLVATQVLQMAQQLLPLLRFDGYHVLADLAGVPDLYQRIRPTLLGLLPHRWRSRENHVLTPWARAVITLWVLVTVPMMVLMLVALVRAVPRLLATAGSVVREDSALVAEAWGAAQPVDVAAHTLQIVGVLLPTAACALILGRLALRYLVGLARWSRGSAPRRITAGLLSAGLLTGLSYAWWPGPDTYRPIEPGERGLITQVLQVRGSDLGPQAVATVPDTDGAQPAYVPTAARTRLAAEEPLVAVFPDGEPLPTKDQPALAMVLVPADRSTTGAAVSPTDPTDVPDGGAPTAGPAPGADDGTWVFPFDRPLPPAEGDNQALAVATTDGSVSYDLAFALVWAEGDEVLNVNEAHAYASCTDCVAVAVAFQVVLIMDDAHVVVPQNLAVAANYECHSCITAAIASQLVLSLDGEPDEQQLLALGEVWDRLTAFAGTITSRSLAEITAELEAVKAEIMLILGQAPPLERTSTATSTSTPTEELPSPTSQEPSPTRTAGTTTSPAGPTLEPPPTTSPGVSPTPIPTTAPAPTSPAPTQEPVAPTGTTTPAPTAPAAPTGQETTTPASAPTPVPTTQEPAPPAATTAP